MTKKSKRCRRCAGLAKKGSVEKGGGKDGLEKKDSTTRKTICEENSLLQGAEQPSTKGVNIRHSQKVLYGRVKKPGWDRDRGSGAVVTDTLGRGETKDGT